jgi:ABC-type transport system involved in cytochrome bd biosynthesis fused ATPase/permease subunit
MDKNSEQEKALEQVKAFNIQSEYFGIPGAIFLGIIGLSIAVGILFKSPLLIFLVAIVAEYPMYRIHRNDIYGLSVWMRAFKRPFNRWSVGYVVNRELIVLDKDGRGEN